MLNEGAHATLEDLARSKGMGKTYVSQILHMTLLAPEVVEAILDGRQSAGLGRAVRPHLWGTGSTGMSG
jgi:hypothetical protein